MTQPSAGQRKQEQIKSFEILHQKLSERDWFGVDDEFLFLVEIVENILAVLKKG